MCEHQILIRLKHTNIKSISGNWYGNCQICNEKFSQQCVEGSCNKSIDNVVFILCNDCFAAVNDICSKFVHNNIVYHFETSYHINDRLRRMKMKKKKKKKYFIHYITIPFIVGNKILF